MATPRIGLLSLYLALYDKALPDIRPQMEAFYAAMAEALTGCGLAVETAPVCRLRSEVSAAVSDFEAGGVDALVTLHLAYSPSLEAAEVLAGTSLPLIILDTTPDYGFGPDRHPDAIMYNHGIHGVQDLCNLLIRHGKAFHIEAGHWERSDVLDRIVSRAQSARMAAAMRTARAGRLGDPFPGMGDFVVPPETLQSTLGVVTVPADPAALHAYLPGPDDMAVAAELAADGRRFDSRGVDSEALTDAVRTGLALRRWLEAERLAALTINFLACNRASGLSTMPFLEIGKAMARGIGYAGEGDVLTAALMGALCSVYPRTTFTEMFCPDWAEERIFLSHMGEVNVDLLDGKAVLAEKPFPWTDVRDPVCPTGCLQGGRAVLVNLAPGPEEEYTLILAPVEMIAGGEPDLLRDTVHGWCRPAQSIDKFLAAYSHLGGTHHCVLVYDADLKALTGFGELMGWQVRILAAEAGA